jgi:uncharacterized protein YyaL (SSP411 family)
MHAHNPVDWYPWGEEALAKAKAEDKPIFLSIGYSSCYWCHVMERESFMDAEIAAFLNEHFVCIKVDREERPDVDNVYMAAVQLMPPGRGGWPLSVFLTPDGKPFFGGTYFPPKRNQNSPGFLEVITTLDDFWKNKRADATTLADKVAEGVGQYLEHQQEGELPAIDASFAAKTHAALTENFDPHCGGFGYSEVNPRQPKFPEPANLMFLLGRAETGDEQALAMLETTLDKMARGGIYDHLGGGFHRYSTDRFWWIPHFEKMLYDNGQLVSIYAEAHALTGNEAYADVARGIAEFVLREMTDPEGGFYSALDAETDAEEGKFYVWTDAELQEALTPEELELVRGTLVWNSAAALATLDEAIRPQAAQVLGAGDEPIFEGKHVLLLARPLAQLAIDLKTTPEALAAELAPIRQKLLDVRSQRERPLTDTKVLTAWNGLMIRGLADAGRILKEERYVAAAARAADFVLARLRTDDGRLLRSYAAGQAKLNAYLDDYTFLVGGLIALHRATGDARWLDAAGQLTEKQFEHYWDDAQGGFYFTSHDHEQLIARGKDPVDSALPAGNTVAVENLIYLSDALGKPEYRERATHAARTALPLLERAPTAAPRLVAAIQPLVAEPH